MTRNECIEMLADYFGCDLDTDDDDNYIIDTSEWTSGCSFGSIDRHWLTLHNVVRALQYGFDSEDD